MRDIIIFTIAFLLPFFYWRLMFVVAKKFAERPKLIGTGIQVHHLHYGIILLLISTAGLLLFGKNTWVVILHGLGLGLIFDEFISSLNLPEHRALGLKLYRASFVGTLMLFSAIVIVIILGGLLYFSI